MVATWGRFWWGFHSCFLSQYLGSEAEISQLLSVDQKMFSSHFGEGRIALSVDTWYIVVCQCFIQSHDVEPYHRGWNKDLGLWRHVTHAIPPKLWWSIWLSYDYYVFPLVLVVFLMYIMTYPPCICFWLWSFSWHGLSVYFFHGHGIAYYYMDSQCIMLAAMICFSSKHRYAYLFVENRLQVLTSSLIFSSFLGIPHNLCLLQCVLMIGSSSYLTH